LTEEEWLNCAKVKQPCVRWLRRHGSDRKFYLAGATAVRQVEVWLQHADSSLALETVERSAPTTSAIYGEFPAAGRAPERREIRIKCIRQKGSNSAPFRTRT
jgi:hypothetical protein